MDFYKDWNKSLSINNDGDVPFSRLVDMTPAEKEQACKNLGVASNDQINRLEGEFIQLRGDMATVSSDVASAVANANSALASASDATTAAQAAIDSITGYATDLATVSSKADTNSGDIITLSSDVSTLSANVGTISGKNTVQDNKIGELSSSVAGLTNSAVYHEATINNLTTAWSAYSADLRNDFDTFSATEDAVITAATAAIPGQISAEVSGQLSGKQDKLTPGVNISLNASNVIDVRNLACTADGNVAVAVGDQTRAYGNYSMTVGNRTSADVYGFAEGSRSIAKGIYSHAEGSGTSAIGQASHAEGRNSIAQGNYSHADGDRVSAVGVYSHAMGKETLASGQYSFAVGNYARALGDESFAIGTLTRAIDADTHAEGVGTSAEGRGAHSEGHNTYANGSYAHAEGEATRAINAGAHAEGYQTSALGIYTHVEGSQNIASGIYSHAEGVASIANGQFSHVEGRANISDTNFQHVEGQYNAPATGALHVIGNGTSTANRSNIVETYTDRVVVNGKNTNDYIQAVNELSKYVYDNTPTPTGVYYGKFYFDTPSFTYSNSTALNDVKIGNVLYGRTYNSSGGGTYMTLTNGALVDWEGDVRRCLFGSNLSGYPNYLPEKLVSMEYFAAYSTGFKELPSGWHVSSMTGLSTYNTFNNAFRGCTKLTGDVTWFMDEVLAGNYPHAAMFSGCTSLSGYSTLTASPTYSSFF